jgi:CubicO group peptidase (beta-lactamase class C family)
MKTDNLNESLAFIENWLDLRYRRETLPGYSVTISHKGGLVFKKAYGYANLEKKEKLKPEHIFRCASHSKTFTAIAIMQLFEDKKLRLDDPVVDHLGWLKKHQDSRLANITIRQLLSHGGGVIRDGLESDFWQLAYAFPDSTQLKKSVLAADLPIDNNVQMKYSNFGFSLLGMIIEACSGISYNDFIEKNIVSALALKNTGTDYSSTIEKTLVSGYTRADVDGKRLPIAHISVNAMSSATGFYSTGEDLCKLYDSLILGSGKLLNDESKKEMQRTHWQVKNVNARREYGLGLTIEYVGQTRFFGHFGAFPGERTATMCDPNEQLVVSFLANSIDAEAMPKCKSVHSVLKYFRENSTDVPAKCDLSKFQGRYMNLWAITEIVVVGDKILAIDPDTWQPFDDDVDELEYIDEQTLRISKAISYSAVGEPVEFNFDDFGKVASISYNGTMWPEAKYLEMVAKQKRIELKSG